MQDARQQLEALENGFQKSALLYFAIKSGLIDFLETKHHTLEQLAKALDTEPEKLIRFLRPLISLNVIKRENNIFSLSDLGELLTKTCGLPHRFRIIVDIEQRWPLWPQLKWALAHQESVFHSLHQCSVWEYRQQHPEYSESFNTSMALESNFFAKEIAKEILIEGEHSVLDVGGGTGALLKALLTHYSDIIATVIDLAEVIAQATALDTENAYKKIQYVAADFFQPLPVKANLIILKSVLHDWKETEVIKILSNCREALLADGKILVIERIIEVEPNLYNELLDLSMLLIHNSKERNIIEYTELANACELKISKHKICSNGFSILCLQKDLRHE